VGTIFGRGGKKIEVHSDRGRREESRGRKEKDTRKIKSDFPSGSENHTPMKNKQGS